MMLLGILALMTAVALGAVIWPLAGARRLGATASDLAVYRDQLEEIERDRADERIGIDEFEAARVEVSRRLLAAAHTANATTESAGKNGRRRFAAVAVAGIVIPLIALALYGALGSPELPGQPLASRAVERSLMAHDGSLDMTKARAALQAKLDQDPKSLEGWLLLGRTDAALGRWSDARADFSKALTLSNRSVDTLQDYAEVLVGEAQGTVTPEAVTVFTEAVGKSSSAFEARYDLALAAAQNGDFAKALGALAGAWGSDLLRVKGIVAFADRNNQPALVQGAQHTMFAPEWLDAWPDDDHRSRLVFIVHDIPRAEILAHFALAAPTIIAAPMAHHHAGGTPAVHV